MVAGNTGFEPFDLQILLGPICRVALNLLGDESGALALRWRVGAAPMPILAGAALALILFVAGHPMAAVAFAAVALLSVAALTIAPLTRLRATLRTRSIRVHGPLALRREDPPRGGMMGTARIYAQVVAEMRRHAWRLAMAVAEVLVLSALEGAQALAAERSLSTTCWAGRRPNCAGCGTCPPPNC